MHLRDAAIVSAVLLVALFFLLQPGKQEGIDAFPEQDNAGEKMDVVILETTEGKITVELMRERAPETVENFVSYVKSGHYDGTIFHRVIKDFMIQGGGFTAEGAQKPVKAPIKLESNNGLKNIRGTIAMARTNDPDSATSQFFINVADNEFLNYAPGNPGYAVFGEVIEGMDTVDKIRSLETETRGYMRDWPKKDIVILKAYIK
jgi:cyclophilin family peptidyl-prolyl cis-trans isomerase